jgi:hypothetical protein
VRSSWVSQRYSSRDDNYHHRSVKRCDTSATNAKQKKQHSTQVTADRSGKIMPQISHDEHGFNNKTYKKDFASKKKKKPSWHVRYASHTTIAGQAATRIALVDEEDQRG